MFPVFTMPMADSVRHLIPKLQFQTPFLLISILINPFNNLQKIIFKLIQAIILQMQAIPIIQQKSDAPNATMLQ